MAKIQDDSTPTQDTIPGQGATGKANEKIVDWGATTSYAGGVKGTYVAPSRDLFGNPMQPYFWGNDDYLALYQMKTDEVVRVQQLLAKAFPGFVPGVVGDRFDSRTVKQFKNALARANQLQSDPNSPLRGKNLNDTLVELTKSPAATSGTSYRNNVSVRLTNPEDLKVVFQKASQQTLGRSLSDQELAKLAESYNSLEKSYGYKIARGGAQTAPPDVSTYGMEEARKASPLEAQAMDYSGYIDALSKMMGG